MRRMKWTRLQALSRKESIHLWRDPRSLIVIFLQPVVLLILYGFAMDLDLKNVAVAVYDQDRSPASRALVRDLDASNYFEVRGIVADPQQIENALDRGQVRGILVIPTGFERDLTAGRGGVGPGPFRRRRFGPEGWTCGPRSFTIRPWTAPSFSCLA